MSTEIIKVLDNLAERFGIAVDWSDKNLIPYMEQLADKITLYTLVSAIVCIIAYVTISTIAIVALKKTYKAYKAFTLNKKHSWETAPGWMYALSTGSASALILSFAFSVLAVHDIIKCLTIPEMVIVEYIKNIIQ